MGYPLLTCGYAAAPKPKLQIAVDSIHRNVDAHLMSRHALASFILAGVSVMPYSGLMPSMEAIQRAVREPLLEAPRDHNGFAVYIFERAREIDRERALAKKADRAKRTAKRNPPTSGAK